MGKEMKWEYLAPVRRRKKVGDLGEQLAIECLGKNGFSNIRDLNDESKNFPYADVMAERGGVRYFISVKSRNEKRRGGRLNDSYNVLLINGTRNKQLKIQGKSQTEITKMLIDEAHQLANQFDAVAAWTTIPIRPCRQSYAAFFGLLDDLGVRRSIPMKPHNYSNYQTLSDWVFDDRITASLTNQ
jgi:Holliday junction resolvase-like predicted endonuclease